MVRADRVTQYPSQLRVLWSVDLQAVQVCPSPLVRHMSVSLDQPLCQGAPDLLPLWLFLIFRSQEYLNFKLLLQVHTRVRAQEKVVSSCSWNCDWTTAVLLVFFLWPFSGSSYSHRCFQVYWTVFLFSHACQLLVIPFETPSPLPLFVLQIRVCASFPQLLFFIYPHKGSFF